MKERWEWRTKNPQIIKDIMWLLKKAGEAKTLEGKDKWLTKIQNWKKAHPFEAKQLDNHLLNLSKKRPFSIINRREKLVESIVKTF